MTIALREFVERSKLKAEQVVRKVAIDMASAVIDMSPVGNPDTWKSNSHRVFARQNYNALAEVQNARALEDAANYTRGGKLRRGVLQPRKSVAALRKAYPNVSGKGYVGGRFRANWQVGIGSVNDDTSAPPDASGQAALGRASAVIATWATGSGTIWISNSLPYAKKLEFGYSKQAPGGMVRLTVQDFRQKFQQAVQEVKS
ncbi:MAG TPA: hypothetical protein PLL72_14240 [Burkholderiaceae bacterium]|nr:hypothetical protein [Burkholderiaceae bacterium]